jgi:hypothetical protein
MSIAAILVRCVEKEMRFDIACAETWLPGGRKKSEIDHRQRGGFRREKKQDFPSHDPGKHHSVPDSPED